MSSSAVKSYDRRQGFERRRYSYHLHIPERRSGEERRSGLDRRVTLDLKEKIKEERLKRFHS